AAAGRPSPSIRSRTACTSSAATTRSRTEESSTDGKGDQHGEAQGRKEGGVSRADEPWPAQGGPARDRRRPRPQAPSRAHPPLELGPQGTRQARRHDRADQPAPATPAHPKEAGDHGQAKEEPARSSQASEQPAS